MSREEIIKAIEEMSVLELSELVKDLEEKFGVSAAAPVMSGLYCSRPDFSATRLQRPSEGADSLRFLPQSAAPRAMAASSS